MKNLATELQNAVLVLKRTQYFCYSALAVAVIALCVAVASISR
jgi:hypothetical protein